MCSHGKRVGLGIVCPRCYIEEVSWKKTSGGIKAASCNIGKVMLYQAGRWNGGYLGALNSSLYNVEGAK